MPLPSQPGVYEDCYRIWEAAARNRTGCRIQVPEGYSKAQYLRMRMNQARSILREQSRRAYDRTHAAWNTSEYDYLKVLLKQDTADEWWLYVEPWGEWAAVAGIEPIPEDEVSLPGPPMLIDDPGPLALIGSTPEEDNLE